MRKYIFNGLAALTMGLAMTSCMKEFSFEEQEQQASLNNAQQTLGFYIPDNQDWVMSSSISANIPINFSDGESYTVKVYSNDPLMDAKGYVLAKETVANGQNFTTSFLAPSYKGAYSIGITDSEGKTMYRTAYLEDGQLTEFIEDKPVEVEASESKTRAITVNGDTYSAFTFPSKADLAAAFPKSIPEDADEVADLESLYKGKTVQTQYGETTLWDLNAIYKNVIVEGYNLKVTKSGIVELGGNHQNAGWNGSANVAYPYNVYVDVDGDLTIRRVGATHFNLYILNGNVTLESNYGEQAGSISVAAGATLNDQRNSIAANQGVKIFNRGTINATNTEKYNIGNNCTVYNEGDFNISGPMTYSPGSSNTSYFINTGDGAELTAPSMTMNSPCHFFTDGIVKIAGETSVTQSAITWINNGHYTTGSIKFSAKNSTFYNYCQLIVNGDGCFKDGSFNMMNNSYAEVNKAVFNNFYVNMGNNSGFNIKNGSKWGQQGQGTPQGFHANNDDARVFVRLGGENQITAHVGAAFHVSGANLVLAYNNIRFFEGSYIGDTYDSSNTWTETTAETLKNKGDGRITWNTHNVTTFVTGDDFNKVTVQTVEGQCAANWTVPGVPSITEENQTWTYAFEDNTTKCDFDMNDVVIQVRESEADATKLIVTLVAAGCEYDNYIWLGEDTKPIEWPDGAEVHEAFGANHGVMVNTGRGVEKKPVITTIPKPADFVDLQNVAFKIRPYKINSERTDENAVSGFIYIANQTTKGKDGKIAKVPLGIAIPAKWRWPLERVVVTDAYPTPDDNSHSGFATYGSEEDPVVRIGLSDWYNYPVSDNVSK